MEKGRSCLPFSMCVRDQQILTILARLVILPRFFWPGKAFAAEEVGRIAHDDPETGFDWEAGPLIE